MTEKISNDLKKYEQFAKNLYASWQSYKLKLPLDVAYEGYIGSKDVDEEWYILAKVVDSLLTDQIVLENLDWKSLKE